MKPFCNPKLDQYAMNAPRVYLFDKPEGIGTFDIIRKVKPYLTRKKEKIGHFGTLDPFATGLVMIAVGGACRLNDLVHEYLPKTYEAHGVLGIKKDTGDHTGETLIEEALPGEIAAWGEREFFELCKHFCANEYFQKPPAFSAVKHKGKGLHHYARKGIVIEKEPVKRKIYSLDILKSEGSSLNFRATVSSGTYIRVLMEDMALKMGTVGHLAALRRSSYGEISVEGASELNLDLYEQWRPLGLEQIIPFPVINFDRSSSFDLSQGRSVKVTEALGEHPFLWAKNDKGELVSLLIPDGELWRAKINFPNHLSADF